MELLFLGRGAAFNPSEGNNSAYFIDNNQLFLIDCGESVFSSLMENNLLDKSMKINLMITHTHSDHIGSLGSLVMYSYYVLHKPINIILPENAKYLGYITHFWNDLFSLPEENVMEIPQYYHPPLHHFTVGLFSSFLANSHSTLLSYLT